MSDVRIERVEACSHGKFRPHMLDEQKECGNQWIDVLDGFPPEAVERAAKAIHGKTLHRTVLSLEGEWDQLSLIVKADRRREAEAALAAAWAVLVGEVSE